MRNQEGKIELQKKVHRRICAKDINFLAPIKMCGITMGGILCDIMSERSKI